MVNKHNDSITLSHDEKYELLMSLIDETSYWITKHQNKKATQNSDYAMGEVAGKLKFAEKVGIISKKELSETLKDLHYNL